MSSIKDSSEESATLPFDAAGKSQSPGQRDKANRSSIGKPWLVCLTIAALGALAFTVDVPISQAMVQGDWPHPLHRVRNAVHKTLLAIEPFGQPAAVLAVSIAVWMCAGPGRGAAYRILAGSFGAGLVVDLLKITVARIRPRHFHFQGTVSDTFHSFLPGPGDSHFQSWPSGHTAMAVGFCLALSAIFPRGRWLFIVLAVLVAFQRIESGSHYLSDTLFATAVAYGVWCHVFGHGRVGRFFDWLDARCAERFAANG
ncbi:MAG: phosphatase PAP2 family protein [Planctomycetia bacterium]|nr:phosphatase PAP2 family protein [Planctomycetia bacterium]